MLQISFFFVIIVANIISDTFIKCYYIKNNNIVFSNLIQDNYVFIIKNTHKYIFSIIFFYINIVKCDHGDVITELAMPL